MTQESDIPMKILKESPDLFPQMLQQHANNAINHLDFSSTLKLADVYRAYRKEQRNDKTIIAILLSYQTYLKYLKTF